MVILQVEGVKSELDTLEVKIRKHLRKKNTATQKELCMEYVMNASDFFKSMQIYVAIAYKCYSFLYFKFKCHYHKNT